MQVLKHSIYIVACLLSINSVSGQINTTDPLAEIKKISRAYQQIPANVISELVLSYSYFERTRDSVVSTDSMSASLKMYAGKFLLKMNDVLQVQDDISNITLYSTDAIMFVQRPVDIRKMLFRFDLLDSLLVSDNIQQVTTSDSGQNRKMIFTLKDGLSLIQLNIVYDTATYFLRSMDYSARKTEPDLDQEVEDPSAFSRMTISFSPFTFSENADTNIFLTSSYFKRQSGHLMPVAPYENFELINSFDE